MAKDSPRLPLTRRDFLKLAGISAVPILAGCAPAAPSSSAPPASGSAPPPASGSVPAPAAPASEIKRGGTMTGAAVWTYPSLDPHISTMAGNLIGLQAMYNSLLQLRLVDAKTWEHKLVGDLAESWEQPDLSTTIFKLKQGVTFHDGTPFDAPVAAWNLLRGRDHPKSFTKAHLSAIESAEAMDKYTLKVKLKAPNAGFLNSLAYVGSNLPMMSKAAHDKLGDDGFARAPVGSGPFKFKQWVTDDRLILDKNPEYFEMGADGKPLPYLDGFVSRYIPDPSVAMVDARTGSIHILERLSAKDTSVAKTDSNFVVHELPWGSDIYFYGGFNVTRPPFDNVKVRQAVLHAIDRESMAKAIGFGIGTPWYYGEWAKGALGYDESIVKHPYNPDRVKQLLTEAGYPDGISIELKVIAREPEQTIGEFVQHMWTAVGVKTKLVAMERLSWIDAVRAMNFDTCFWRGSFSYTAVDPDTAVSRITTGAASNWAQWGDPDVDRLMKEGGAVADRTKRHEVYKQVLTILQEKALLYSGINVPYVNVYRKEVQGVTHNFALPDLKAAWLKS
jgi:peptide/nickel transport system substrate-binding protein